MEADTIARKNAISPDRVTLAVEGWNADDLEDPNLLVRSLRSLKNQTFPLDQAEVLLVCSAQAPEPSATVREIFSNARILRIDGFTYYRCKNLVMRKARGDVLLLADSDVLYAPEWAEQLLRRISPDTPLIAGRTRFSRGFLSRTLDLCDGGMVLPRDGFTTSFYGHNAAIARELFERIHFDETLGQSGGGAVEALCAELAAQGVRPWFTPAAESEHLLPPFLAKRLRVGSFHMHVRRNSAGVRGARLAHVPILAPLLVCSGVLLMTWRRIWRRRAELPGGALAVPLYVATSAFARAVELVGACSYAWTPWLLQKHMQWHVVPSSSQAGRPSGG